MPTFLTTPKMSPELAARVQASVNGRRATPGRRRAPHLIVLVRLTVFVFAGLLVASVLYLRHREREEREAERATLATAAARRRAELTEEDQRTLGRIEGALVRAAGAYEGDVTSDDLRAPGSLAGLVARGAVYVRGEQRSFQNAAGVADAARNSTKDAFVLCLIDPPAARVEKALLAKVRLAYSVRGELESASANVRPLVDLVTGMPFLSATFAERVRGATDVGGLRRLHRAFEKAPLDAAIRAAKSRLLVFVVDEPSAPGGPVELDGEKAHTVRVGVVDLAVERTLLRLRKNVDPAWITPARRTDSANGLDSCALALDVHQSLTPEAPTKAL